MSDIPKFESRIPDEFLDAKTDPGIRRIIHSTDILTQMNEHQCRDLGAIRTDVASHKERIEKLEAGVDQQQRRVNILSRTRKNIIWIASSVGGVAIFVLGKVLDWVLAKPR